MRIFFAFIAIVLASDASCALTTPPCEQQMHICAFHIAKDDPKIVIETQHYCTALNDNLFQCLLYQTTPEGTKPKLLGVEYVITDVLYQKLPTEEKKYWHPHDYEVRQGLLALLDATREEDQETMKLLVKTWGKTWHTWPDPTTDIPYGLPLLMWSATKEGEIPREMIEKRDQRWHINTLQLKKERDLYLPR